MAFYLLSCSAVTAASASAAAFASLFARNFLPAKNPASAIAAKITIMIAYCKNDPKNAISSTCLSAMADTYALQKCKPAHNLNIIAHFVLYRQGIQRLFFALSLKIRVFF